MVPALMMLLLVKVVGGPLLPVVLELLKCLLPGHSIHFEIRIVNSG